MLSCFFTTSLITPEPDRFVLNLESVFSSLPVTALTFRFGLLPVLFELYESFLLSLVILISRSSLSLKNLVSSSSWLSSLSLIFISPLALLAER